MNVRIALLTLLFSLSLKAEDNPFFPTEDLMPVGAYYYPEHWDESQWERDLSKIAELGFEFTHFAEFSWARLEPEEGKFDFEWLDRNVELAAKFGLKVIMCTPTPTPPAWITNQYPEILSVNEDGRKIRHGTRLQAAGTHPAYLHFVERIVTKLAERYGNDDRIWGWQIDNEPHYHSLYDYSDHALQQFRNWLRDKYGDIDQLNKAWGAAFWSHTYNNFSQIRIPNKKETGNVNPHALLDFQRFTAEEQAKFIRFQAQILMGHVSEQQWVTTNYAYYKFLPPVDLFLGRDDLHFAAHTMYLLSTFLNYPEGDLAHRLGSGMELSFSGELARSINGYTGIMELQPGQINWGKWNSQPLPGAVRMWIWHAFALGDKFTCTYRFRQPIYGSEQYHKGIVETDGVTLARGGAEYVQALEETSSLRDLYKPVEEPAEYAGRRTAFLWKQSNLFVGLNDPHNENWDAWQHLYTYYENLKTLGAPITFLQETDEFDVEKYPFMVAPAYELLDEALVQKWMDYVKAGGHLILSSRTGLKDNHGHLWEALLQEPIWPLIGAKVDFYDHLPPGTNGKIEMQDTVYEWNVWADGLTPDEGTEVWAEHTDQFYAGTPVVTHRELGKGTVTYIGAWSNDRELEKQAMRRVYQRTGAEILDLPNYAFTEWRDGFWVTVNYTSEDVQAPIHDGANVLFGEATVPPGGVAVWQTQ